ncbi:hypothetical protein JCM10213_004144 [Rhodosporidiobolus nylandii]
MAAQQGGPCCVCGFETVLRCGECSKAGFELYVCSREHQKLIWPVHKLVCWPRSNPFLWPDLSPEELDDAKQNLEFRRAEEDERETLASFFTEFHKRPLSDAPKRMYYLLGEDSPLPIDLKQANIMCVRSREAMRVQAERNVKQQQTHTSLPPARPVDILRASTLVVFRPFLSLCRNPVTATPDWWTPWLHTVVIWLALDRLAPGSDETYAIRPFATYASRQLWKLTNTQVRKTHPDEADAFLSLFKTSAEREEQRRGAVVA